MPTKNVVSFRCDPRLEKEIRKLAEYLGCTISFAIEQSVLRGAYAWSEEYKAEQAKHSVLHRDTDNTSK